MVRVSGPSTPQCRHCRRGGNSCVEARISENARPITRLTTRRRQSLPRVTYTASPKTRISGRPAGGPGVRRWDHVHRLHYIRHSRPQLPPTAKPRGRYHQIGATSHHAYVRIVYCPFFPVHDLRSFQPLHRAKNPYTTLHRQAAHATHRPPIEMEPDTHQSYQPPAQTDGARRPELLHPSASRPSRPQHGAQNSSYYNPLPSSQLPSRIACAFTNN